MSEPMSAERLAEIRLGTDLVLNGAWRPGGEDDLRKWAVVLAGGSRELLAEVDRLEAESNALRGRPDWLTTPMRFYASRQPQDAPRAANGAGVALGDDTQADEATA